MVRVAALGPVAAGWKVTSMVQLAPGPRLAGQVLAVMPKSPPAWEVRLTPVIASGESPVLLRVIVFAGLVVPIPTLPLFAMVNIVTP